MEEDDFMIAQAVKVEEHQFQAETKRLLDLMIHSLYTNKEIFLRELISNPSDALDKLRFEALTNPILLEEDDKYEIRLEADKETRTLSISDTGIGMSRDEMWESVRERIEVLAQRPSSRQGDHGREE